MISVYKAKQMREEIGATHLVVLAIDSEGNQHVATHGESEKDAREAAIIGNHLKTALGWHEELCKSKPLERIHENCRFYIKVETQILNGWPESGPKGRCNIEPTNVKKIRSEKICKHFEPRN